MRSWSIPSPLIRMLYGFGGDGLGIDQDRTVQLLRGAGETGKHRRAGIIGLLGRPHTPWRPGACVAQRRDPTKGHEPVKARKRGSRPLNALR